MHHDSMPRNSARKDDEASYMMSYATLQIAIEKTHALLRATSYNDAVKKRLEQHLHELLNAQSCRASAVRMTRAA